MDNNHDDIGVILAVIQRFETQRLPRMTELRVKLDKGNALNEFDIEYLSEALHDTQLVLPYMDRHPEYESLICNVIHLYKVITDDALAKAE